MTDNGSCYRSKPSEQSANASAFAPLDRGVGAEGAANDFAQRLGAVDDEQPTDRRVEPALDEIIDQRLDFTRVGERDR